MPKYTDQQMALILKRAAEMQAVGGEPVHSLESIQQIALQVGIDPKLVADVAASLETTTADASIFGATSSYRLTRRLAGAFEKADHAAVAATIRDHLPSAGEVRQVADGIEWHSGPADNKTVVALSPGTDGTTLRIDARQNGPKVMLHLAGFSTGMIATMISVGLWHAPGVGVGLAAFAASFVGARAIWNRFAKQRNKRFQELSDALTEQLENPTPPSE